MRVEVIVQYLSWSCHTDITTRLPDGRTKEVETLVRMRQIVDRLMEVHHQILTASPAFDGKKNLYTTLDIRQDNVSDSILFRIMYVLMRLYSSPFAYPGTPVLIVESSMFVSGALGIQLNPGIYPALLM